MDLRSPFAKMATTKSRNGTNPRRNRTNPTTNSNNRTNPNMNQEANRTNPNNNGTNSSFNIAIEPMDDEHFKLLGIYRNAEPENLDYNWQKPSQVPGKKPKNGLL